MAQTLTDVFDIRIQFPIDLRTVKADMNARNAIETFQRYEGLTVWVVAEQRKYRLIGGIENTNWVDVTESAGLQAVTVSPSTPTGGNPGDIHFKTVAGGFEVWYNNAGTWGSVGTIPTGGDTPTLQQVTDEGNTTDNAIQVSGTDNADTGVDSAVVRYTGTDAIFSALIGGSEKAAVSLGSDSAVVSAGASQVRLALSGTLGARFLGASSVLITVKGADAVDDNDFVTKRQLDSVAPTRTPDPSLSFSTTSADMESAHPTAAIGDIFYNVDGTDIYVATKIATGIWQIQQSGT